MKEKVCFSCTECGGNIPKWMGQCPYCNSWNTIEEISTVKHVNSRNDHWVESKSEITRLADISADDSCVRTRTAIAELDRVLGGGIVPGSVILIGGDPGIGKSTLVLQAVKNICTDSEVLYITGEESPAQIKLRANRLKIDSPNLLLYPETNIETILTTAAATTPGLLIIDSIQTIHSNDSESLSGSVSQVRNVTSKLLRFAKLTTTSVIIIGHVTKDGSIAGPRILEHMVDTVLYFEGDSSLSYRILRSIKNRFGSTNEIGVFEMQEDGLREISNPSEFFLEERSAQIPGSIVTACIEGTRPILIELQALVSPSKFGIPRRGVVGVDQNRLSIILAVMEKRMGLQLQSCDIYVNVVGGIRIAEPAVDLGIVMAVGSSYKNKPIDAGITAFGEIGLGGEVRAISQVEQRVKEASKMFFKKCIIPKKNAAKLKKKVKDIEIIGVRHIGEALQYV